MRELKSRSKITPHVEEIATYILDEIEQQDNARVKQSFIEDGIWNDTLSEQSIRDQIEGQKPILIVVTTPKTEEEYQQTEEYNCLLNQKFLNTVNMGQEYIRNMVQVEIVSENTEGLPKVYNQFLSKEYKDFYVCFIHDDLSLVDMNFYNNLQVSHQKAQIVGLAGATRIYMPINMGQGTDRERPTLWHLMAINPKDPKERRTSGVVTHDDGKKTWTTVFGDTNQKCRLIDGLFMSFDVEQCLKYDLRFDERFNFHHYDLSVCLDANKKGMDIITTHIHAVHKGLGDSAHSDGWKDSHKKFCDLYGKFDG